MTAPKIDLLRRYQRAEFVPLHFVELLRKARAKAQITPKKASTNQ